MSMRDGAAPSLRNQMLDWAIAEVEKLLDETLQDFSLYLRAAAVSTSSRLAQERARLHNRT